MVICYNGFIMVQLRKNPLENGHFYHVYSRSIAGYRIFNDHSDYERMNELINLYNHADFNYKYSTYSNLTLPTQIDILTGLSQSQKLLTENIAFCLMPTHFHLLLKQKESNGISKFIGRVLNGYSRYFNARYCRQGPLWSGRFKSVLVTSDEQLLHLTRYLHLNPTSAGLVEKPEQWKYSSYEKYINEEKDGILQHEELFAIPPKQYKKFVMNRKDYQKELSKIKSLVIEDYTG